MYYESYTLILILLGSNEGLEEETKCIYAGLLSFNGGKPTKDPGGIIHLHM